MKKGSWEEYQKWEKSNKGSKGAMRGTKSSAAPPHLARYQMYGKDADSKIVKASKGLASQYKSSSSASDGWIRGKRGGLYRMENGKKVYKSK